MKPPAKKIYLISDSTGELGERFTNALLSQFPKSPIVLKKHPFVQTREEAAKAFAKIPLAHRGILFHTVLSPELKKTIETFCRKRGIPAFDLTGPPTDFMVRHLNVRPVWDLRSLHPTNQDYDRRIDAIEFTISHDDGAGQATLKEADVILVGPSRVSKTPTSIYLAIKGCRTANVPLIKEIGVPAALQKLAGDPRVVGFTLQPLKLQEVREKRIAQFGAAPGFYADLRKISREILWVEEIYKQFNWRVIDVTDRAIEETAAMILKGLSLKRS